MEEKILSVYTPLIFILKLGQITSPCRNEGGYMANIWGYTLIIYRTNRLIGESNLFLFY